MYSKFTHIIILCQKHDDRGFIETQRNAWCSKLGHNVDIIQCVVQHFHKWQIGIPFSNNCSNDREVLSQNRSFFRNSVRSFFKDVSSEMPSLRLTSSFRFMLSWLNFIYWLMRINSSSGKSCFNSSTMSITL